MTSEFVPATEDPFPAKRAARARSMGSASLRFIPTRLVCAHHECKPLKVSRVVLPARDDTRRLVGDGVRRTETSSLSTRQQGQPGVPWSRGRVTVALRFPLAH